LIERASEFGEVGAGVQVSPNAARVLDHLGLAPDNIHIRRWEDDALLLDNPMGSAARERYGFPSYNLYRPDLIGMLAEAAQSIRARFGARVVAAESGANGASVELADGTRLEADLVIGADGELADLQAEFAAWSPAVAEILSKVDRPVFRWALHDREELPSWTTGNVALLGDACHPMLPFMGQGACQAIEDSIVLARSVTRSSDLATGLAQYESIRKPRATRIQNSSWGNRVTYHLPDGPEQVGRDERYASVSADEGLSILDWVYGHNPLDD
jgi:2-polyprenyl-6-methoxyphenol hydroxylase-like FAD-dependent oxidoreductase